MHAPKPFRRKPPRRHAGQRPGHRSTSWVDSTLPWLLLAGLLLAVMAVRYWPWR